MLQIVTGMYFRTGVRLHATVTPRGVAVGGPSTERIWR
jgi:hypothetical protein